MPKISISLAYVIAVALLGTGTLACAQELVIATFGGSFAEDTKTCHVTPFEEQTGAKAILTVGSSVQHAAKLRAMQGNPDVDVVYMDDSVAEQAKAEGLLQKTSFEQLASFPNIAKQAFDADGFYVNFMTAGTVIAYNPEIVKEKPDSWEDLFDPQYYGRLALGDITGTSGLHFLLAVNRMRGGDLDNLDPGFAAIKELAPHSLVFYTQADQIVALFERGEIVIAPWYPDRAGSAADKGVPVAVAYPKEGAVGIRPTISIPKGAANAELAMKFIDIVLSAEGQNCFAERKYAGPVNTTVNLSDKVRAIVPFGEDFERMWYPDNSVVASKRAEWTERWQREITR